MKYQVTGKSNADGTAGFSVRDNSVSFGITEDEKQLPNPAELLLGAFAGCCLKSIERFSKLMKFEYSSAEIEVTGERQDTPPKMTLIKYSIKIKSDDKRLNPELLHKNVQRHGTIFNTLKGSCDIVGNLEIA